MMTDLLAREPVEDRRPGRLRPGRGHCVAHHGELLQGVFAGPQGGTPALITLPCPAFEARALFDARPMSRLTVCPGRPGGASDDYRKALAAARLALEHFREAGVGGVLRLDSRIPRGRGLGSSTAEVIAVIRAVADALGRSLSGTAVARLAVAAEEASDALMFDEPVLFASQHGAVLEYLPGTLPAFRVLGLDAEPEGPGVDTLTFRRPAYDRDELACFELLRAAARRALRDADPRLLARVATASTRIDLRHRPNPVIAMLLERHQDWGAVGVQRAHSGTVTGLLFDPQSPASLLDRARSELDRLRIKSTWSFYAGHH